MTDAVSLRSTGEASPVRPEGDSLPIRVRHLASSGSAEAGGRAMVTRRDGTIRFGVAAAAAERPPGPDSEVPAARPTRRQFARRCRLGIAEEIGQSRRILQHRKGRASRGRS